MRHSESHTIRVEIISAILMSACAITLIALYQGIEMFLEKGNNNYDRHDALLISFIIAGGTFIVGTIWFIYPSIRVKERENSNEKS